LRKEERKEGDVNEEKQKIGGNDSFPRFVDKSPRTLCLQQRSPCFSPLAKEFYFKHLKRPHANANSSGETVVSFSCRSGSGQPACRNQNQEMPERIDVSSDAVASGTQRHGTHTMTRPGQDKSLSG
jgi:hypothetical protein